MTKKTQLRIAIAQCNLLVGDIDGNVTRILELARQARDTLAADAIVFPELTLTGYPPEDLLLRPGMYERVARGLESLRQQVEGIDVIAGYPERTAQGVYNAAALFREGEYPVVCHKQHLPNYSVFDERRYFLPGSGACVADLKGVAVGITICEDIWHAGPVQEAVSAGAQLIINLNASPFHLEKVDEREAMVRRRVAECGLPVIYVNLVGGQDELVFDGESFVMDGTGLVTQRAPAFEEGLHVVECEVQANQPARPVPGPLVQKLDPEASIYQALVLGVRDYIGKNGFGGAVIGLSGGIDSALTLAVAVDAIGPEAVEAVSMPSRYTAQMSITDAREEADILGVPLQVINIEPAFTCFLDLLKGEFDDLPVDTTEENIQARCRGVLLMAISNKKRKIVLTTGNKSELAVGYATLYGDMAGGYDVLKDVPKTLVYRLAEYRNRIQPVIPRRVIERPPSAELAPDQQDTDSLPDYAVLDGILAMYVEQDQGVEDIVAAGFEPQTVRRVVQLVDRNEYKRRQAPPGVRISRRAFGRDRRYPITSGYGRNRGRSV